MIHITLATQLVLGTYIKEYKRNVQHKVKFASSLTGPIGQQGKCMTKFLVFQQINTTKSHNFNVECDHDRVRTRESTSLQPWKGKRLTVFEMTLYNKFDQLCSIKISEIATCITRHIAVANMFQKQIDVKYMERFDINKSQRGQSCSL